MTDIISWNDDEAAAAAMANNHARFNNFCWHNPPDVEDLENWALFYTHNRDSSLLAESNADAIAAELKEFLEADYPDIFAERHYHWGCGWVDGYSIRVYCETSAGKEVTPVFKRYCELMHALESYPVLDEEDFSNREHEATLENITLAGCGLVSEAAPDDWASQTFSWFWDNDQSAVEPRDGDGGYPTTPQMMEALKELGWLDQEFQEKETQ